MRNIINLPRICAEGISLPLRAKDTISAKITAEYAIASSLSSSLQSGQGAAGDYRLRKKREPRARRVSR